MANSVSNATAPLWSLVRAALIFQLAWVALSMLWNIGGVIQLSHGLRAPGPTASLLLAAVLLAYGAALAIGLRRWPMTYVVLSALGIVLALPAIINGLTADPSLWPSEFWRYAGMVLNGTGALACVAGLAGYVKWKRDLVGRVRAA